MLKEGGLESMDMSFLVTRIQSGGFFNMDVFQFSLFLMVEGENIRVQKSP